MINIVKRISLKSSPARRQAFRAASKLPQVKVIIATEPEKVSLIDNIVDIAHPILSNEADIVIPKREDNLFRKTYPDYMYKSETKANQLYNKLLKLHKVFKNKYEQIDIFFGPKAIKNDSKILNLFFKQPLKITQFDPEMYSNTLFFPVVLALRKGFKVKNIQIPFKYPKIQKKNESRGARNFFIQKRRNQSIQMLSELKYLLSSFTL
ncbi:hypothetical protein A3A45_00220 [Candidatus Daviesbacteria bacterium RIFCSPLOWO2_01_FULL_36_8]|nr:MAG: hypothetical protein A3A45_00220 [Candidatus Daviesbacteria bacterium RIFCSPLOWO2_01_FULL_36_8]